MRQLPINLDELAFVLHRGEDLDMECFLNLETGEILYIPTDSDVLHFMFHQISLPELVSVTSLAERIFPDISKLLYIPDNFRDIVFDLMNQFANIPNINDAIRTKLLNAIHRQGGFRVFRQVVNDSPGLLAKFIQFRDDFFLEKALEWLKKHEIVPLASSPERDGKNEESLNETH